jgi:CBS domain-containing protein
MVIREVMTDEVVTAAPQRTVREIAELMRERNVGSVVIVEDDRPVGFVTDRDLTLSVIADGRDFGDHVADHASSPVVTAEPAMGVEEAAGLMVRHGVRRLVVVDAERLTGIVTLDDLASRTGDAELASQLSARVTRAVMPDFFFHERGGG